MVYWLIKGFLKPLMRLIYKIEVTGLENVPKKGPAIIAANHLSFLDSFFIPLVIKRRKMTYLAKADYFKSWKTAWFVRSVGQISCEREGGKKAQQSLDIALEVLTEQKLLGIYPEGTRSPDGKLHRGRTGVARLALQAGVPVVPAGLVGTDLVQPKNRKFPRITGRIKVQMKFGQPLDFSRHAGQEKDRFVLRSVTDEIVYEIMQLSGQDYVDEYASKKSTLPMPESVRLVDDIDLRDEVLAG